MKALIGLFVLLAFLPSHAVAQLEGRYEVAIKKQEEKKSSRWSLADWLAQKQKNRLMDNWLAKNSQTSSFEFFLAAQSLNYHQYNATTPDARTNRNNYNAMLGAYAGLAGLRASYEGDNESRSGWSGSFNLRLLGRALQDTHVNVEYGLQGLATSSAAAIGSAAGQPTEAFQNQFGGVSINLYVTKHFGFDGSYKKILPAESDRGRQLQGEVSQAGVFIDFSLLRVFGSWRKELLSIDGAGSGGSALPGSSEVREGFGGGLKLFF